MILQTETGLSWGSDDTDLISYTNASDNLHMKKNSASEVWISSNSDSDINRQKQQNQQYYSNNNNLMNCETYANIPQQGKYIYHCYIT